MASRKSSRGGKRMNRRTQMTRKQRGVFTTLVTPVAGLVETASGVAGKGLNVVVAVPTTFGKGVFNTAGVAKNTVKGSLTTLVKGVTNMGMYAAEGIDKTVSKTFSRKNSRKAKASRKASRKAMKGGKKAKKASRKAKKNY